MHMKDDRDFKVSTPVTVTIREEIREMIIILCLRLFSWVSKELSNVRSPLLEPQAFSTFQPKIIYIYIKTTFPENEKRKNPQQNGVIKLHRVVSGRKETRGFRFLLTVSDIILPIQSLLSEKNVSPSNDGRAEARFASSFNKR